MLSVGKLAAGPSAGRYYEEAVALGREDYYAGEGERPGRWVGGGAEELGLEGEVVEGQVGHLLSGEDPSSGQALGRPIEEGSVAGFDLTFSTPKSVSIAFAIGDPWTARVLRECHEQAVNDALAYLEREACRARRGKAGALVIEGKGFAAAAFDHRTSRAGDPSLHTHVVVANRTLGEDGRWTALDARPLYKQAKTAGFIYQARLRHEITERTGARWGPVRKGAADLHGFSAKLIDHFSRRRAEIRERMALHDSHGLVATKAAVLATRKGKDYGVPMGRLREEWRTRAAEHGMPQSLVEELLSPRWRERHTPGEVDLDKLTERSSTFTRREVLQAVCEAHLDGAATVAEIEAQADAILARDEIVRIPDPAGTRYTTQHQLQLEQGLLQAAESKRDKGIAVADPGETQKALGKRELSDEQAAAVRSLTSSGHGVEILRAPAGAGKTFALDAAREAWEASGKQVVGCALSAQAARELREQGSVEATTIADLKNKLDHGYRLPQDGVLIVDEAGMVGTRDLATLNVWCEHTNTKLLLVGDDRQLPEIEAGGMFRALAERTKPVELTQVHRQKHEWDRDALRALRDGKPADWAQAYIDHARIETAPTAPALRKKLVSDWWQAEQTGADARMIALRRADVADLNQRARRKMRDADRLQGPDIELGNKSFAVGDQIVIGHNDRRLGVINGDRGHVTAADEHHLDIQLDDGSEIWLPATFVEDGHVDHGYATTAHKAQGATVDEAFVLGSQEAYREWGYTALSRHRDQARFYITAPKPFLNHEPPQLDKPEQLKLELENALDDSRRHELATDQVERFTLEPLDNNPPVPGRKPKKKLQPLDEKTKNRDHASQPKLEPLDNDPPHHDLPPKKKFRLLQDVLRDRKRDRERDSDFKLEPLDDEQRPITEETRRRAHDLLPDLDEPRELPAPEPPDLADDIGMDFGP